MSFDGNSHTYVTLIRHAIRAGDAAAARDLLKLGREAVPEEQRADIEQAAQQIP